MERRLKFLAASILFLCSALPASASDAVSCSDHRISANAVRTTSDIKAFVQCAYELIQEVGADEAYRAFHEDDRWHSADGSIYVFVSGIAESGAGSMAFVFPPNPSREGTAWGPLVDDYGTDFVSEHFRMTSIVDAGWLYYSFLNPTTGRTEPKASYLIEIDWKGNRAAVGAGIYRRDIPGTCDSAEVNAALLESEPSEQRLQEFVRCAAMVVESKGYFARSELEGNPRWSQGSSYVFVMDMMGNQVLTGSNVRVNGAALHEWGGRSMPTDQFGGRDMVTVGDVFGEAFISYWALNPTTGASQAKVGFLKRVVAHGVPLLVGAGYYISPGRAVAATSCSDHSVTAGALREREDVRAFVQCAAEYVAVHGTEEAHRAFVEDQRWRHGPYYVFVRLLAKPGQYDRSRLLVFPPDRAPEGITGPRVHDNRDFFDTFHELHRILGMSEAGWVYHFFENFVSGTVEPKSTHVMAIDWNGQRAAIGAGIYQRDLPGACGSAEVNAAALEADPSNEKLREFVRCAAMKVQSMGYFAGPILARDPRWRHGSIYVFAINMVTRETEFSGSPRSFAVSGRGPELLFGGRDLERVAADFGEAFWYYNFANRETGAVGRKVAFAKLVLAQGVPLLMASGYHLD